MQLLLEPSSVRLRKSRRRNNAFLGPCHSALAPGRLGPQATPGARARVNSKRIYKGYTFSDISTPTDDGRYRARAVIVALDGENIRSQRFFDLETFRTEAEAHERTEGAAMAWIDRAAKPEQLSLPTNFSHLNDSD
jgi:hypothetical protein